MIHLLGIVLALGLALLPWWSVTVVSASGNEQAVSFSAATLSPLLVLLSVSSALAVLVATLVPAVGRRVCYVLAVLLQIGAVAACWSLLYAAGDLIEVRVANQSANLGVDAEVVGQPWGYVFIALTLLLAAWSVWSVIVSGRWPQKKAKFDRRDTATVAPADQASISTESLDDVEVWDAISDGSDPTR